MVWFIATTRTYIQCTSTQNGENTITLWSQGPAKPKKWLRVKTPVADMFLKPTTLNIGISGECYHATVFTLWLGIGIRKKQHTFGGSETQGKI